MFLVFLIFFQTTRESPAYMFVPIPNFGIWNFFSASESKRRRIVGENGFSRFRRQAQLPRAAKATYQD
jgi:hypothetical protein